MWLLAHYITEYAAKNDSQKYIDYIHSTELEKTIPAFPFLLQSHSSLVGKKLQAHK